MTHPDVHFGRIPLDSTLPFHRRFLIWALLKLHEFGSRSFRLSIWLRVNIVFIRIYTTLPETHFSPLKIEETHLSWWIFQCHVSFQGGFVGLSPPTPWTSLAPGLTGGALYSLHAISCGQRPLGRPGGHKGLRFFAASWDFQMKCQPGRFWSKRCLKPTESDCFETLITWCVKKICERNPWVHHFFLI